MTERVLWTGAPQRVPLFEPFDRIAIPIQAIVVAVAVIIAVVNAGRPMAIFVWLFVAVGVLAVPARMIARRRTARASRYTVTDQRLIVQTRDREFSEYLRDLLPPALHTHNDGTGTIVFSAGRLVPAGQPKTGHRFTLWGIPDAQRVRDIIVRAQEAAA